MGFGINVKAYTENMRSPHAQSKSPQPPTMQRPTHNCKRPTPHQNAKPNEKKKQSPRRNVIRPTQKCKGQLHTGGAVVFPNPNGH